MSLRTGDLVYFARGKDEPGGGGGVLFADPNTRHVGVEQPWEGVGGGGDGCVGDGPWRFTHAVFRLCPKLDYRARLELAKLKEALAMERHHRAHLALQTASIGADGTESGGEAFGGGSAASRARRAAHELAQAVARAAAEARQNALELGRQTGGDGHVLR